MKFKLASIGWSKDGSKSILRGETGLKSDCGDQISDALP